MKYKDYYAALGVSRDASADEIKKAYRKLAQKHHPDVSKEQGAEEKFKEVAEAYQTLKDPERRAAYDQLGSAYQPGQEFRPPPDWAKQFAEGGRFSFDDLDLADLPPERPRPLLRPAARPVGGRARNDDRGADARRRGEPQDSCGNGGGTQAPPREEGIAAARRRRGRPLRDRADREPHGDQRTRAGALRATRARIGLQSPRALRRGEDAWLLTLRKRSGCTRQPR